MSRIRNSLVCLWLASLLAACGSSSDADPIKTSAEIVFFAATPSTIQKGQAAILSWTVTDARRVELLDVEGNILAAELPQDGTHSVSPEERTTYRLVATGADAREVSSETTIEVSLGDGPTVELVAEPERVAFGSSTTLKWTSTDADRVILRSGSEILLDSTEELTGELVVEPKNSTIYEITASGPAGESSSAAQAIVEPVIVSFGGALSEPVGVGNSIGLSWETLGAEELILSTPEGFSLTIEEAKKDRGTAIAVVGESGTFELLARRGNEEVRAIFEVDLIEKPLVSLLEIDPRLLTRGIDTLVTVSWTLERTDSAQLVAGDAQWPIESQDLSSGSMELTFSDAASIRLEATNVAGTTVRTVELEAIEPPMISLLAAAPSRVGVGEEFVIRWESTGATAVSLFRGEEAVVTDSAETSGEFTQSIDADTTFRLEAVNALGATDSRELSVLVGEPIIRTFEVEKLQVGEGGDIHFSWKVSGGALIELKDAEGESVAGCTFAGGAEETGACVVAAPLESGYHSWTLEVQNAAGLAERELTLLVSAGPWIDDFKALPAKLNHQETVRLSWQVTNDLAGAQPTLSLVDDQGAVVDIGAADLNKGYVDLTMEVVGVHVYTLSASTEATRVVTAEAEVEVVALPAVTAAASQPTFDPGVDTAISLSWSSSDAVSVAIHPIHGLSTGVGEAVYTAAPAEVAQGSWTVVPSFAVHRWRVIATNELGATASADVSVDMLGTPPTISSFAASATRVSAGASVDLWWTTGGTTTLSPVLGTGPTEIEGPGSAFIPRGPSATLLEMGDCGDDVDYNGCAPFDFPGGFRFPFDGTYHTAAHVFVNGALGFDMTPDPGETWIPRNFPSSANRFVNLAALWTDLYTWNGGSIWYELRGTTPDRELIVHWTDMTDWDEEDDYTFQLILRENGSFDYRYETLDLFLWGSDAFDEAVVGFQDLDASASHMYKQKDDFRGPDAGDLAGLSIRYLESDESPVGQRTVVVDRTTIFTVCSTGNGGRQCESLTVTVE